MKNKSAIISFVVFLTFLAGPIKLWAVTASEIHKSDEVEASFCLGLLNSAASKISYSDGQVINFLGEFLSKDPETSIASRQGRLAATTFFESAATDDIISARLESCRHNLSKVITTYVNYPCGIKSGRLSDIWSDREFNKFYSIIKSIK